MKVLLVGSIPETLLLLRGPLLRALVLAGHDVVALTGHADPRISDELAGMGVAFATYPLDRVGTGPMDDLATFRGLVQRFRELRPDAVIAYTAKPVIWGALAARRTRVPCFHAMITGRGQQFDVAGPFGLRAALLRRLYRHALARVDTVIFQNADDRSYFIDEGLVTADHTALVNGSGVDLDCWQLAPLSDGPPTFLMAARLLLAKGIVEYAEAARRIRIDFPDARFMLAGAPEDGARGVPLPLIEQWQSSGTLEYLGALPDIAQAMADCHVYTLPSYYGEGVPRTILEAMAMGRPVLSTDNVGCRDAVAHEVTGRLVAPRDVNALEQGMRWFLAHPERWASMGQAGRRRCEQIYDVKMVDARLLEIMSLEAA